MPGRTPAAAGAADTGVGAPHNSMTDARKALSVSRRPGRATGIRELYCSRGATDCSRGAKGVAQFVESPFRAGPHGRGLQADSVASTFTSTCRHCGQPSNARAPRLSCPS